MSRWKLLRDKLSGSNSSNATSMHRHSGFHLLPKAKCLWQWKIEVNLLVFCTWTKFIEHCYTLCQSCDTSEILLTLTIPEEQSYIRDAIVDTGCSLECLRHFKDNSYFFTCSHTPLYPHVTYNCYSLPSVSGAGCVYTRERSSDAAISVSDLLSHQVHGVDNTGNICTWEAESLLLHTLLHYHQDALKNKVILELGGGATALCGLGLAVSGIGNQVIVTDGHPDCVRNQRSCIAMNQLCTPTITPITSQRLRWATGDPHGELAALPSANIILASDCLFFRDFHDDLIWLLRHAIADSEGGRIYLLQPERSGSMRLFIAKAEEYFVINEIQDYNEQVTLMHKKYMQEQEHVPETERVYNPDIHYPILLILKLKSSF